VPVACALFFLLFATPVFALAISSHEKRTTWGEVARTESGTPIRPGVPGKAPFWNEYSRRYIYAPALNFREVPGAKSYRVQICCETSTTASRQVPPGAKPAKWPKDFGLVFGYTVNKPWAPIEAETWRHIPVGYVHVRVMALDEQSTMIKGMQAKRFYRASPFNGPYHQPPPLPYDASARLALKRLLQQDYVQYWIDHNSPDPAYRFYRYPAKIYSALVIGAVTQARLTSGTAEALQCVTLPRRIADFMLEIRFGAHSAWAGHVPTYYAPLMGKISKPHMNPKNHLTTMGVDAGNAFLDLYDLTGDAKYRNAAVTIAETYKKTQLPEGSWPINVEFASGKPIAPNVAIPTAMINYFDRLRRDYHVRDLDEMTSRALAWTMENPAKTFNWQGQFEDVAPQKPYKNQSREQACELAMYLFRNHQQMALAEDLVRFAEDQFVIWQDPMFYGIKNSKPGYSSPDWITPSVQEQYVFWEPVGRAAGIMVQTFWAAYEATGNQLYREKALSLANSFPTVQAHWDGDYTTFFARHRTNYWLNSTVYPARVLMQLEQEISNPRKAAAAPEM